VLEVVTTRERLAAVLAGRRRRGRRVGLVPTMGALHAGHVSLVEAASAGSDSVVLSMFVNPLQFDRDEDYERYPRDPDGDLKTAEAAGVEIIFMPSVVEMYPAGSPQVTVDPGPLGDVLEGASRPGHFAGVATVVAKLFALVMPAAAYFGEKDYQQLEIVRRLAADLSFPVEVVGCPTVREPDGLALSSRNRRLGPEERAAATVLYRALIRGREVLGSAGHSAPAVEQAMVEVVAGEPFATLDYAVARAAGALDRTGSLDAAREIRLLIAARLGPVRLIDNLGVAS